MTAQGSLFRVGFLGAGRMATALAKGWLRGGLVAPEHVTAGDPLASARQTFEAETGLRCAENNREVVLRSDVLVLAVKPQSMATLLAEIRPVLTAEHLILSIAAGITLRQLADGLGAGDLGAGVDAGLGEALLHGEHTLHAGPDAEPGDLGLGVDAVSLQREDAGVVTVVKLTDQSGSDGSAVSLP